MEEAIHRFLTHLQQVRGSAGNTILAYRADLRQFDQVIARAAGASIQVEQLTPNLLTAYSGWLERQRYRPATVARKLAAVRSFLDYLNRHETWVDPVLSTALRAEPTPRSTPRILSPEEVEALLSSPARTEGPRGLRDAAILALLYSTGLRAAEVVALHVEHLDLDRAQVARPFEAGQRLPLGAALEALRRYLEAGRPHLLRNPEEPALFLNQRGRRLTRQGLWLVVKRWAEAAGLGSDISPHTLRHTLAHDLLRQGRSRREVQKILGLNSPNAVRLHSDGNLG